MIRITRVILPALLVFAKSVPALAFSAPPDKTACQIQPISGIMESVETKSNQKKKELK